MTSKNSHLPQTLYQPPQEMKKERKEYIFPTPTPTGDIRRLRERISKTWEWFENELNARINNGSVVKNKEKDPDYEIGEVEEKLCDMCDRRIKTECTCEIDYCYRCNNWVRECKCRRYDEESDDDSD